MGTGVTPQRVLRDLQDYWAQLAHDQAEGVLKACSMTLVVVAQGEGDAEGGLVRRTLGALMHQHPSRTIVIASHTTGQLDAGIFAECWKPFGKNQQICSEGIEIKPGSQGLEETARFVSGLVVPDLPVVLWCRGPLDRTYMYRKRFEPLYALAGKIIFDSREVVDAEAALEFLRGLRASGRRVADLHWARLTGWRETLAHLFDDRAMQPDQVASASVAYGGAEVTTCALYFAAWIRAALPGIRVSVLKEEGAAGLSSVTLEGAGVRLRLARAGESCLEVEGAGRRYQAALPVSGEEALMGQELRILGPDPAWERTLAA
jgi:glucose-6-phosphate dehydrogenase assembly protein OpcA